MDRKNLSMIVVIILLVAGLSLYLVLSGDNETDKIRIGYIAGDIHHLPFSVANNGSVGGGESIFAKHNLTVESKAYANGGVIMENGFAQGEIDIAYLGAAPAISKHLNLGKSILNTTIISQVNEEGSLLVADSTVTTSNDLIGKKVATPGRATIQYFMLLKYLEDNGINKSDVTIIDLASGLMQTQMEKPLDDTDHLNAFIVWEPIGSAVVAAGSGHILATSHNIWPHHPCCVIAVSNSFLAEHEEMAEHFIAAHKETIDWINDALEDTESDNYQLLLDLGTSFTTKNETVVSSSLTYVHYKYQLTPTFTQMVEEYTEKLIEFGIVQSTALQSNGNDYSSIEDFALRYVDEQYVQ